MAGKKDVTLKAVSAAKMAAELMNKPAVNRIDMSFKDVTQRVPELTEAAKLLKAGKVTPEQYAELVSRVKPVTPYNFVPQPASAEEAVNALTSNKKPMYGKTKEIEAGEKADLRLDIPAYSQHGVWVNSIHRKDKPTVYGAVSSVKNAIMVPSSEKALKVATGETPKAPFAVIRGEWNPMDEQSAVEAAQKYLKDPAWRQVGYDPERHGYFYDRETMQPIVAADEVLQIGPLVIAKEPKYADPKEFPFKHGGAVHMQDGGVLDAIEAAKEADYPRMPITSGPMSLEEIVQRLNDIERFGIEGHSGVVRPTRAKPANRVTNAIEAAKMAGAARAGIPMSAPSLDEMRRQIEEAASQTAALKKVIKPEDKYNPALSFLPPQTPQSIRHAFQKGFKDIGPSVQVAQIDGKPIGATTAPGGAIDLLGTVASVYNLPTEAAAEEVFSRTGSPLAAAATSVFADPFALAGAPAVGRKVAKAATPLLREAGERFNQAYLSGEGPLGALTMAARPMRLDVYHGSPHRFPPTPRNPLGEFDPTKIGTGEGAQAYGYGHYLAESPGVAKSYVPRSPIYEEKLLAKYNAAQEAGNYPMMEVLEDAMLHRTPQEILERYAGEEAGYTAAHQKAAKEFAKWAKKNPPEVGSFYKVDLPDEQIAKMLDLDKPLSEQPEIIKALKGTDYEIGISQKEAEKIADMRLRNEADDWAFETGGDPVDYINNANWEKYVDDARKESGRIDSNITGAKLHEMVMRDQGYRPDLFDSYDYQVDASEALRGYGIPGVKYFDADSRGAKEGTRNFVVFPGGEEMLTIKERMKKGGPVHKQAGGALGVAARFGRNLKNLGPKKKTEIFIGNKSPMWNAGAAGEAVKLETAGVDPAEIWKRTGTFRSPDGALRQEISDVNAKFRTAPQIKEVAKGMKEQEDEIKRRIAESKIHPDMFPKQLKEAQKTERSRAKEIRAARTGEYGPEKSAERTGNRAEFAIEHPELYQAYPELKNVVVTQGGNYGNMLGSFSRDVVGQDIGDLYLYEKGLRNDPRSTSLHEMQHAIQGIEGWGRGGNTAMAFNDPAAFEILERMRNEAKTPMSFEHFREAYDHLGPEEARVVYDKYVKELPKRISVFDRDLQQQAAEEYYRRLAGEAEARATQERINMGPTERRETFPLSSYDVLPEDVIVRRKKGGPVSLDAMRMAVGGMAGGGLRLASEGIKGAGKVARRMASKVEGPKPTSIIKEKGGNWIGGTIESAVKPLRSNQVEEEIYQKFLKQNNPDFAAWVRDKWVSDPGYRRKSGIVAVNEYLKEKGLQPLKIGGKEGAMNEWIDKQLSRYIQNEMGTAQDPVRALAERGVSHAYTRPQREGVMSILVGKRAGQGMPFKNVATTPEGKAWEDAADFAIDPVRAGDWGENIVHENPWLSKLDPESKTYSVLGTDLRGELGFEHLVDELRNAMDPDSGLPRELLIKPESLSRLSVPQAVERVAKINEWREKVRAAADAAKAANPATQVFKEYPEGYRWVQIKAPKTLPEGYRFESGRVYDSTGNVVWSGSGGEDAAIAAFNREALSDALRYEGDTMGHCVGGYCDEVAKGNTRIYSLRDEKGMPHVTIETRPAVKIENYLDYLDQATEQAKLLPQGYTDEDVRKIARQLALENEPASINQIKGKSNLPPKEDYLPFVQDFVKSQKWSSVRDLQNANLIGLDPKSDLAAYLRNEGRDIPQFITQDELTQLSRERAQKFNLPYKKGGPVSIEAMRMAVGGESAKKGIKVVKKISEAVNKYGASERARAGVNAAELIKTQPPIRASEALGQLMEKGFKRTTTTQADRTRVGGGNIGGPSFPILGQVDPAYAGKSWGVGDYPTASRLTNLTSPETAWTTMLGSATQLKTNPVVFDRLKRQFLKSMKEGNLSPELEAKINHNLALTFGEGASIRDPKIWKEADTFEKRAALADIMMGQGIDPSKGGVALGGEKSGKGVIFKPTETLIKETEPGLLHPEHGGDVPTFASGPRLFTIGKETYYEPELHPGFPVLLSGEDLGYNMRPVPTEIYLPEWHKRFKEKFPERKKAGYYDLTLGLKGEGLPSQELSDEYIRHLLREGYKKGGKVKSTNMDAMKFAVADKKLKGKRHG